MTFLLVQHLDLRRRDMLLEILARQTDMRVSVADGDAELRPDTVYIIRPGSALAVRDGRIEMTDPDGQPGAQLIDHLFRSLAREYGSRAVGIVLSGAGSDGSAGVREIRAAGGLTIAQDPRSSEHKSMPQCAIDATVDLVLPIADMPAALERFATLPPETRREPSAPALSDEGEHLSDGLDERQLEQLAALLEAHRSFDLRVYKPATVERRIRRRLALSGLDGVDAYLEHLRSNTKEQETLLRDLLISVTRFFRDPDAFAALREQVIAPLVDRAVDGDPLRIWVPGCATGEEAYSIGIELLEAIESRGRRLPVQIFATDVDASALATARIGIFPPTVSEQVSSERLQRYFRGLDQRGYQVRPELRNAIAFTSHDLLRDAPFSRMDLVSCRNVLIYLTSEAQKKLLRALHFALERHGHLFLSASESTGAQAALFSAVSKRWRIFKKVGVSTLMPAARRTTQRLGPALPADAGRPGHQELARRAVLQAWAPPTVVVTESDAVRFIHGELSPFLQFPQGEDPRLELTAMLRPELATRARAALYRCRRENHTVAAVSSPQGEPRVRITARPAPELGERAVMLSFETLDPAPIARVVADVTGNDLVIDQLERELQATREDLHNTVDELEASNEALRSSNEESMSVNEELQAANEELEATTEELRSLNVELTTVNAQLRDKVGQLEQAHDDLDNFLSSTKVATMFLDEELRIKRFTPAAAELLSIGPGDLGRHVGDIGRDLLQRGLVDQAREVLDKLAPEEAELRAEDARWFTRAVLPYRTEGRRIAGVVVTFADITELKRASRRLERHGRQQAVIAQLGIRALREPDLVKLLVRVVQDVQETLDTDLCSIFELQPGGEDLLLRAGLGWHDGAVGAATVDGSIRTQVGYTLERNEPILVEDVREEKRFAVAPLLADSGVVSGLTCVIGAGEDRYGVIGAHARTPRQFSAQDATFLQSIATIVGSALKLAQIHTHAILETGAAQAVADATDTRAAEIGVIGVLADELGATIGELWKLDGALLVRDHLHVNPASERGAVEAALDTGPFSPGEGLIGQAFDSRAALWCTDLGTPTLFSRRVQAMALGLTTGLAVPIDRAQRCTGVMALFFRERPLVSSDFLRSLEAIGRLVGDSVDRLEAEERARHLAAITESSQDAIICYTTDGQVTDWLPGAEELFGYSAEEMVGQSITRIVPEDRRAELSAVNQRIAGEVVDAFETVRLDHSGRLREISVRSSPIRDSAGVMVGVSSTDRDIGPFKEAERRLLEADRQKDEFLAMLGHELRNPLAAIRSATELLATDRDPDRFERAHSILTRQSAHMSKLLDGLLDVSRIIRGKIKLERTVVDLVEICRETVSDLMTRHDGRELDFRTRLPGGPITVEGDRVRLVQIVDNLLSNAIKYTPDGGAISVSLEQADGAATLRIRDTGVGIAPELLPQIFDVFRQSEQSIDRASGGLGLGLALVKSLTELHGGQVEARNDGLDQGAELTVQLPLASAAARPPLATGDRSGVDALSIVVVEDNDDAAEMLRMVLELRGHAVTVANRGRDGVDLARVTDPDVVICDLGLPDISGYDVVRELRAGGSRARLIALSGYGRPEDIRRGHEVGFDAHITKPLSSADLNRVLHELFATG